MYKGVINCPSVSFTLVTQHKVLAEVSQSNVSSVCSSSIDPGKKILLVPNVCIDQFTHHVCDVTVPSLSGNSTTIN